MRLRFFNYNYACKDPATVEVEMEFDVSDLEIVPNNRRVIVRDDPAQIATLLQFGDVYDRIARGSRYESQLMNIRLVVDDAPLTCEVKMVMEPRPTLVVRLAGNSNGKGLYMLLRDGTIDSARPKWSFSNRLLALPVAKLEVWGEDDAGLEQSAGRILLFVGLANINGWFQASPEGALPED